MMLDAQVLQAPLLDHRQLDLEAARCVTYIIEQSFRYDYDAPVKSLRQRLVVIPPARHGSQYRRGHLLEVSGATARRSVHRDTHGNVITWVRSESVAEAVEFRLAAVVERVREDGPTVLAAQAARSPRLLRPTRLTAADDRLRAMARDLARHDDTPLERAGRICAAAHAAIGYGDGVTSVRTTAAEALALGRGVCQDFAHIMLALCHLAELPARYVSGHLLGQGGTHAWVEVILPEAIARGGGGRVRPVPRRPGRQRLRHRGHRAGLLRRGPDVRLLRRSGVRPPHRRPPGRHPGRVRLTPAPRYSSCSFRLMTCGREEIGNENATLRIYAFVVADIFDSYQLAAAWDEMFERPGQPRASYQAMLTALQPLDPSELRYRADQMARGFTDRGVTFDHAGEERPFPLDLIPRIIDAIEWDHIALGVRQRVLALEAFLADVYGAGQVFTDGVLPRRLVLTSQHFRREAAGLNPANGVRVHVAGIDLIRDEQGEFRVLEDNLRTPSGVSYVVENRLAMTRTFPALFAEQHVHPVDEYPARLLAALRAAAPPQATDPVVVLLTPGVYNPAYFEHTLLARLMGVELVEGRDLACTGNRVYVHTTQGSQPVDVIYRRVDDEFLDPLQFRPGSVIGCPGLLNAARAGQVTIANAVGNGVADDKLLYTYVPDLIRYYLGEEPLLGNVESYRLGDPGVLDWVLGRLRPARAEARGRRGRQRDRHRPARGRAHPGRAAREGGGASPELGGAAAGRAVHLAGADRRAPVPAPHRPAAVRRERRPRRVAAARGPDPGGAGRGRPGRELQPGRRVQGHLGAGRAGAHGPDLRHPAATAGAGSRAGRDSVIGRQGGPAQSEQQGEQQ